MNGIAISHNIDRYDTVRKSRLNAANLRDAISNHATSSCSRCAGYISVFEAISNPKTATERWKKFSKKNPVKFQKKSDLKDYQNIRPVLSDSQIKFPPQSKSLSGITSIVNDFCSNMEPKHFEEVRCTVCGMLTLKHNACKKSDLSIDWKILETNNDVTRKERTSELDCIENIKGPILDVDCEYICPDCSKRLRKNVIPLLSLYNGNWIGQIPDVLKDLSFAEKLLISRVRTNWCVVRVKSGMHKMRANAIMFPNPMPKIYEALPPHRTEMDQVLAFVYTGPVKPTEEILRRTPILVRRCKITAALQ